MKATYEFNCVGILTVWERHIEGDAKSVIDALNVLFDDCFLRDHSYTAGALYGRHMWAPVYVDTNKPVEALKQVRKAFFESTFGEQFVLRHGVWRYLPKFEEHMCKADSRLHAKFRKQADVK